MASTKRKAFLGGNKQGHVVHVFFETTSCGKGTRRRNVQ
jgi:hypothetical protein